MTPDDVIDHMIAVLNRALAADPEAIRRLFSHVETCNTTLRDDPTIQCHADPPAVGVMGLINGLCGVDERGNGPICYVADVFGRVSRFQRFIPRKQTGSEMADEMQRLRDQLAALSQRVEDVVELLDPPPGIVG